MLPGFCTIPSDETAEGTTGQATLIVPANAVYDDRLESVGELVRTETDDLIVGYTFDLRTSELTPQTAPNPAASKRHTFVAYRLRNTGSGEVVMKDPGRLELAPSEE